MEEYFEYDVCTLQYIMKAKNKYVAETGIMPTELRISKNHAVTISMSMPVIGDAIYPALKTGDVLLGMKVIVVDNVMMPAFGGDIGNS